MGKWPSGHDQVTKTRLSDGCGGKAIPMAVPFWYGCHEFEGYPGNVCSSSFFRGGRGPGLERRSKHDQSQGPPTGEGEGGAESQKAGSQHRPTRPQDPPRSVRSGNEFDIEPGGDGRCRELRHGQTGGCTVEIGRAAAPGRKASMASSRSAGISSR